MKVTALVTAALCATGALAAPGTARRRARAAAKLAERGSGIRASNPRMPYIAGPEAESAELDFAPTNVSHVDYSSNWAGAVLVGSGYTKVTATVVVPTPKKPSGGSNSQTYSASAWVGIDGDTCGTAILQTGFDVSITGSTVSFDAWYEWYPDYAYDFSGFPISVGDSITMTVTATSKSAGKATLVNNTKGKTVSHSFSSESNQLCEQNAEWIVEDFEEGSSLVPFANFGTITFTGASTNKGGPSGADIIDLKQGNTVYTDCSASSSSVTCKYTGP